MKKTVTPALILTAICLVVVSLLVLTNLLTEERIAIAEREATLSAAKSVLPAASTLKEIEKEGFSGFVGYDSEQNVVGYVFLGSDKGYGGDVTAIVGITTDGKITGVSIQAPNETPGLGANVSKDSFTEQFVGKDAVENVTAVSGATYSSEAAKAGITEALKSFHTYTEEEGK